MFILFKEDLENYNDNTLDKIIKILKNIFGKPNEQDIDHKNLYNVINYAKLYLKNKHHSEKSIINK